jgi:O-antigen/teichoic acid export membrane protein
MLPLLCGFVAIWTLWFTQQEQLKLSESIGVGLMVATPAILQLLSIPQVSLYSAGRGYVGGISTMIQICVASTAIAILLNAGVKLVAIPSSQIATATVLAVYLHTKATKQLEWYTFRFRGVKSIARNITESIHVTLGSIGNLVLQQADILLVAAVHGSAIAGQCALSMTLVRGIEAIGRVINASILPENGQQLAAQRYENVFNDLNAQIKRIDTYMSLAMGPALMLTAPLLRHWIGPGIYQGEVTVAAAFIITFSRLKLNKTSQLLDQLGDYTYRTGVTLIALVAMCSVGALAAAVDMNAGELLGLLSLLSVITSEIIANRLDVRLGQKNNYHFKSLTYTMAAIVLILTIGGTGASRTPSIPLICVAQTGITILFRWHPIIEDSQILVKHVAQMIQRAMPRSYRKEQSINNEKQQETESAVKL